MQSEDAGVGIGYLGREKKAWLLSSWQIVTNDARYLENGQGSDMAICGEGALALRNFAIIDENGGYLVKANSYWFLMNTETGRPMRILESDTAPTENQPENRDGRCRKKDRCAEGDGRDRSSGSYEASPGHKSPCK